MWACLGFGGLAGLFLFLLISFSRFQYFNLPLGSLKHCFTNLVLEIQYNLSLIFLYLLEISKLIYFTHFRLFPIIMGHISKIRLKFVQYAKIIINPKTIRFRILWPLFGSLDRESWVV